MTHKILVVDDEPDIELLVRQQFRKRIRTRELEFVFAQNGEEAMQRLQEHADVDLVLSDINMPVMDGLSLLARINENSGTRKAVMVSAYGDLRNIRMAMNRGAYDFVVKPIDFEDLETTIDKTIAEVLRLKEAIRTREHLLLIEQELSVAHQIQQSMLPPGSAVFPGRDDFSIFAESQAARVVGGDFYDYFLLDDSHVGVVIGDVSGKGVPAALFMAVSRTLLRATAKLGLSPGDCLTYVNQTLVAQSLSSMFVTVFYAILNTGTGELTYSLGGHNPPYILTRSGSVRALPGEPCCVVGAVEAVTYTTESLRLELGDCLLMYTDGVPEAMNERDELFSEERLEAILSARAAEPADRLVRSILNDVREFSGSDSLSDDTTVFALRYSGAPQ